MVKKIKFYFYFSKCDYECMYIQKLLEKYPFEEIKVEEEDIEELYDKFAKDTKNYRKLPMVFIDNLFIGGYENVKKLLE